MTTLRLFIPRADLSALASGAGVLYLRPSLWVRERLYDKAGKPRIYDNVALSTHPTAPVEWHGFEGVDMVGRKGGWWYEIRLKQERK